MYSNCTQCTALYSVYLEITTDSIGDCSKLSIKTKLTMPLDLAMLIDSTYS